MKRSFLVSSSLVLSCLAQGCEDGPIVAYPPDPAPDPGALVAVSLDSTVGVLLDELPASMRDRVAEAVANKAEIFWVNRAREQLRLTGIRFNFRQFHYDEAEGKAQLPLPPEEVRKITLSSKGPRRTTIDGHDLVVWDYHVESYLVTAADSPGVSEKALAEVGGVWGEPMVLPVDPTLLMERTGYACLSEADFPAESADTENAFLFYDDTCEVELPTAPFCHITMPGPSETCPEALERTSGRVETTFRFERVAWDEGIASEYRVGGIQTAGAPDLNVREDFLENNHIVWRYFPEGHCALQEQCIAAPGWRRLLMFDAVDENVGDMPLEIGAVDYYLPEGGNPEAENALHGMYEYSACHGHFHFMHYGDFELEGANFVSQKAGFCLQATDRVANHEASPLNHPYGSCDFQGISVGWADKYQAGLPCQWLDITESGVKGAPVGATLRFVSNPRGFLCEGTPVLDDKGQQVWEPTEYETASGASVERPVCELAEGSAENNLGEVPVTISERGSVTTEPCRKGQIGPYRNCEMKELDDTATCTPGEVVKLSCGVADPERPQVLRACEYSEEHGHGMPCSAVGALANAILAGGAVEVELVCPKARGGAETGGRYALYTAPLWNPDGPSAVTCWEAP